MRYLICRPDQWSAVCEIVPDVGNPRSHPTDGRFLSNRNGLPDFTAEQHIALESLGVTLLTHDEVMVIIESEGWNTQEGE